MTARRVLFAVAALAAAFHAWQLNDGLNWHLGQQ